MDLTEEHIVEMLKVMRAKKLVDEEAEKKLAKGYEAIFGPKKKEAEERAEADGGFEFKMPKAFLDEKGNVKPKHMPYLFLMWRGFGYDEKSGMVRESWADSAKAELEKLEVEDVRFFNLARQSASTLKSYWEKYLKQ